MATYTIQIPVGQLSDERKAALPEAAKAAHAKTTGAPRDLTQATVLEISSACFWLHGTPPERHQIFIHGFVAGDAGHPPRGPALCDAVALRWRAPRTSNSGASWNDLRGAGR
jgi:hypothetical protein